MVNLNRSPSPAQNPRRQLLNGRAHRFAAFVVTSSFITITFTMILLLTKQPVVSSRPLAVAAFRQPKRRLSSSLIQFGIRQSEGAYHHDDRPYRIISTQLRSQFGAHPLAFLGRQSLYRPLVGSTCTFATSTGDESSNDNYFALEEEDPMAHVYEAWTLEQDQLLWEQYADKKKSIPELASILGRGLQGVKARLNKLNNVDSPAYQRLFQGKGDANDDNLTPSAGGKKEKLVPVSEVLRRIQWDHMLQMEDFRILHYDRVEDKVMESPMDAPNTSIQGSATSLIDALPEHRIVGVKYKERIVWDREERVDLVFGNTDGGIYQIIQDYDNWKKQRDMAMEWNRQRQAQVSQKIEQILGYDRFMSLKALSKELQEQKQSITDTMKENRKQQKNDGDDVSSVSSLLSSSSFKSDITKYVQASLQLFRDARNDPYLVSLVEIPATDFLACDCFSELVALLPDNELRPLILDELSLLMDRFESKKNNNDSSGSSNKLNELPELLEEDLDESFIRGSGPGGQKINKTSNRVVLIHKPTQLKVECQDTRSLQQNRKIARKKLRLKLDEFINGSSSRTQIKAQKAKTQRSKSKARNKARLEKKRQAKMLEQQELLSSVPATGGGGGGGGSHSVSSKRLTPFVNLIMDIDVRQGKDAIQTSSQTASTATTADASTFPSSGTSSRFDNNENGDDILSSLLGSPRLRDVFFENHFGTSTVYVPRKVCELPSPLQDTFDLGNLYNECEFINLRKDGSCHFLDKSIMSYEELQSYIMDEGGSAVISIGGEPPPSTKIPNPIHDFYSLKHVLEDYFGYTLSFNIYHSGPNGSALLPHYDSYDVFVLQLQGEKTWDIEVDASPSAATTTTTTTVIEDDCGTTTNGNDRDDKHDMNEKEFEQATSNSLTLQPGDLLYMPKGVIHSARTASGFSSTTHLTIGLEGGGSTSPSSITTSAAN